MHPEMSLVLLTVLAGAGQGIFILLVALEALFYNSGTLPSDYILASAAASFVLQAAGIIMSTSHLGNPQRGWRAILMLKNSWLSREVLTLSLSAGAVVLYALLFYFKASADILLAVGLAGVAANIGFYMASSMVYASVKFIKEWANAFTPANFLLFGATSGFGAGLSVLHFTHAEASLISGVTRLLIVLAVVSLIMKALAYRYNAKAYISVNIKNAVGINDPDIKLMDMGTSYSHYNTMEYSCHVSEQGVRTMKNLVLVIAFAVPLLLWSISASAYADRYSALLSTLAAVSMIAGLVLERRLFFIQGNNLQNLYYSNFRHTGAKNPLLRRARKGTPVPAN